jgi:hypothetical protein
MWYRNSRENLFIGLGKALTNNRLVAMIEDEIQGTLSTHTHDDYSNLIERSVFFLFLAAGLLST